MVSEERGGEVPKRKNGYEEKRTWEEIKEISCKILDLGDRGE